MNPDNEHEGSLATLPEPPPERSVPRPMPKQAPIHESWGDEEEKVTGFKKYRVPLVVAVFTLAGIVFAVVAFSKAGSGNVRKETTLTIVDIRPSPPPPPPPPPPPETMKDDMVKPEEQEEEVPDTAPVVETSVKGPGSGGIAVPAGNRSMFGSKSSGPSKGARWAAYAPQAQARIADAIRNNARTRKANARVTIRIWVDSTGRIIRATLGSSTGDATIDNALRDEVLTGLQLQQPPPDDMKMPIVMRVTARRP